MAEEDLMRRLFEQQRLNEHLQLEKQRLLDTISQNSASKQKIQDNRISPFLSSGKRAEYKYIPNEMDGKIAGKAVETIINTWNHENQYFPDDVILRSIQRQSRKTSFQKELTPLGKENMEEILMEARQVLKKREKQSLKEKYQNRSYKKEAVSDPFENVVIEEKKFQ